MHISGNVNSRLWSCKTNLSTQFHKTRFSRVHIVSAPRRSNLHTLLVILLSNGNMANFTSPNFPNSESENEKTFQITVKNYIGIKWQFKRRCLSLQIYSNCIVLKITKWLFCYNFISLFRYALFILSLRISFTKSSRFFQRIHFF